MLSTKGKRGRPRLHREKIDKGTEELQIKRKMLLKNGKVQDPSLAESLLGLLYAHELISRPLYEAGRFFGELGYRYEPCLGHTFRSRISVLSPNYGKGRSLISDRRDEKDTKAWRKALKALKQAGPHSTKIVLEVVFYTPELYTDTLPRPLLEEIELLQQGLACLDSYFKGELKDKKGMLSYLV